ncbi:hypothetical protein M407DRAFT_5884 [Tulasnella calospora MUT 4182]|uniref:Uncharacterized protein n=1 Tax=Tulasnella calospora MUT 4182 TaxID=1051891 RepID=A0A0C3QP97_9AGAM|nr:hypothetical protein M407DRAFT_5884 [Tulasnella calospora MUT 4182]
MTSHLAERSQSRPSQQPPVSFASSAFLSISTNTSNLYCFGQIARKDNRRTRRHLERIARRDSPSSGAAWAPSLEGGGPPQSSYTTDYIFLIFHTLRLVSIRVRLCKWRKQAESQGSALSQASLHSLLLNPLVAYRTNFSLSSEVQITFLEDRLGECSIFSSYDDSSDASTTIRHSVVDVELLRPQGDDLAFGSRRPRVERFDQAPVLPGCAWGAIGALGGGNTREVFNGWRGEREGELHEAPRTASESSLGDFNDDDVEPLEENLVSGEASEESFGYPTSGSSPSSRSSSNYSFHSTKLSVSPPSSPITS